jgi:hypothetical protein
MDFDARDCNPPFFASRGTENWIIHGFEVMKGNLTRAREKARPRARARSDPIALKIESAARMQKKKKASRTVWKQRWNPNNSGTTQLLHHNGFVDCEFFWHGVLRDRTNSRG